MCITERDGMMAPRRPPWCRVHLAGKCPPRTRRLRGRMRPGSSANTTATFCGPMPCGSAFLMPLGLGAKRRQFVAVYAPPVLHFPHDDAGIGFNGAPSYAALTSRSCCEEVSTTTGIVEGEEETFVVIVPALLEHDELTEQPVFPQVVPHLPRSSSAHDCDSEAGQSPACTAR